MIYRVVFLTLESLRVIAQAMAFSLPQDNALCNCLAAKKQADLQEFRKK